jgi:hypothetical protein
VSDQLRALADFPQAMIDPELRQFFLRAVLGQSLSQR